MRSDRRLVFALEKYCAIEYETAHTVHAQEVCYFSNDGVILERKHGAFIWQVGRLGRPDNSEAR